MFGRKRIPLKSMFASQPIQKGKKMSDPSDVGKPNDINIFDQVTTFFNSLSGQLLNGQREILFGCIDNCINYDARIGILGMTGAGKSSLCNALVGNEVAEVGIVDVCTRTPQEILLAKKEHASISVVDFPGMGVDTDWTEKDLLELYKDSLRYLDLFLWVLKGDDRAYYDKNMNIYRELFQHTEQGGDPPVIFVISQVDKITPAKHWGVDKPEPRLEQRKSIEMKIRSVQQQFNVPRAQLCAVSSREGYGLVELIYKIFTNLPNRPPTVISYSELSGSNKAPGVSAGPH
ncbi:MAG: 50S ribosome-binding GTPase [Burkholderiaceae bacterium]|jgi:predicted GTPase|nr:50S ribosome-binding GTPase [Burkholderiaceae bacterium]